MFGIIDSHCHLNHEKMAPGDTPAGLMDRARAVGVAGALTICCKISDEFEGVREIARTVPNVWCTVGTHPHEAGVDAEIAVTEDQILAHVQSDPRVIGVGETGLDYYYNLSDHPAQHASFRKHIRAAARAGVPLIIHARDADEDIIKILQEEGAGVDPRVRGVMHCFSSTRWLAEQSLDIGFYISFSGILTFKKSTELQSIARTIRMDRILIETDAPYLAPEPLRGKVNEPAYVSHTAKFLADLRGITVDELAARTTENFFRLFDKARA
jgi:TatD DNase family protein